MACPKDLIEMDDLVPVARVDTADLTCGECTDCLQMCPGLSPGTHAVEERMFGRARRDDERWLGIYDELVACWALDDAVHSRSGAGGAVSALLAHAMHHLQLDWALVCGRRGDKPWRAAPAICRNPTEVHQYSQSTYQLTPHLIGLYDVLRQEEESRGAIVGLPCHFQALRGIQALASPVGDRARKRVAFTIEIACSSNTLPSGTEALLVDELGLELQHVTRVFYRDATCEGVAYPGVFSAETVDGTRHELPLWRAFRTFKRHKTHRCLSCPDWLSGLTDVSVFDGDPNIFVASVNGTSDYAKHGTVLIRTPLGAAVLRSAQNAGVVGVRQTDLPPGNLGLERKRSRRVLHERGARPIPEPPIPGYVEPGECVDDDELLSVPADIRKHEGEAD